MSANSDIAVALAIGIFIGFSAGCVFAIWLLRGSRKIQTSADTDSGIRPEIEGHAHYPRVFRKLGN